MLRRPGLFLLGLSLLLTPQLALAKAAPGQYLFVWVGDQASQGNDFLAVIDSDPDSATYGQLLTTLETDQQSVRIHHTEYEMSDSGMLFANDHDANRSYIFDLREPLSPKIAASFSDLGGFAKPHSFLRLPNGNVMASFMHVSGTGFHPGMAMGGGLVEIDDSGNAVRSASNVDPAFPDTLMMPYSLAVLPDLDRILSTNSPMTAEEPAGTTVQLWRLSDLTLLKTAYLDPGKDLYAHINPEEARVGPDGAVYVQTLSCGLERISGLVDGDLKTQLVHVFPGTFCGVPTVIGNYWVQSVPTIHGFIVLDISNGEQPREVSRLVINDTFRSHWTGWDPSSERLVVTSGKAGDRMYLLKLDQETGALSVDESFRGVDGQPGFSFGPRDWPHGWSGVGQPHGAVFSK